MSVLEKLDELGWIIDHQCWIDGIYSQTRVCSSHSVHVNDESSQHCCCVMHHFKLSAELFAICEEFLMDSQFQKITQNQSEAKNRRKRKRVLTQGETMWTAHHNQIEQRVDECLQRLRSNDFRVTSYDSEHTNDNNRSAREIAKQLKFCVQVPVKCESDETIKPFNLATAGNLIFTSDDLVNRLIENPLTLPTLAMLGNEKFLLPPQCRFLLSDMSYIQPLIEDGTKYDCIVIDPPWQNKSVKRKKTYETLSELDLLKLPIRELSKNNTVIVVWVTNKLKQHKFVEDTLFKHWNVQHQTRWHWLKVTRFGKPVCSLHNLNSTKRPYETLIIGRVGEGEPNTADGLSIPEDAVIISVPSSIHSMKPPLDGILRQYLPDNSSCLELFARNLLPGWTSWGNEVLLHQHVNLFRESEVS